MKIGIDISQSIYEGTGVAEYVRRLVDSLLELDNTNEYILFYSNHRIRLEEGSFAGLPCPSFLTPCNDRLKTRPNVTIKSFRIPIWFLEFLWNRLHIFPIEWFIGKVDVFYTSDWVEPPTQRAKKITTIHDLSVLKMPETFDRKIVDVHTHKLQWVVKESDAILCDSKATKKDAIELLGIEPSRLHVVYPGINSKLKIQK